MASGWRQDGVRMRQDGVRQASEVCQVRVVGVRDASGCIRMRLEGVRVASGRRQDNLASGWRQDDVKRRGARRRWPRRPHTPCTTGSKMRNNPERNRNLDSKSFCNSSPPG